MAKRDTQADAEQYIKEQIIDKEIVESNVDPSTDLAHISWYEIWLHDSDTQEDPEILYQSQYFYD